MSVSGSPVETHEAPDPWTSIPVCNVTSNSDLLNIENHDELVPFLAQHGELERGEQAQCQNLAGGVSNRTVRVVRAGKPNLIVKQALSKLRVEADWFSSQDRIHREYAALGVFAALLPGKVPVAILEDIQFHVIAMGEIPAPYINWKEGMLAGSIEIAHWISFGKMLAHVHTTTNKGLTGLPASLRDKSFFETLRLEPYYEYSGQQVPNVSEFLNDLIAETRSLSISLVHGDFSPKNVLIHNNSLYLLDFEVCHIGDPAFDVGFGLTHALSKALRLPQLRKELVQGAYRYWQGYSENRALQALDARIEPRVVRHTLACLLARAVGRSPLEYLSREQRLWQAQTAVDLIHMEIETVPDLIAEFRQLL